MAVAVPPVLRSPPGVRLVERDTQLDALRNAHKAAAGGHGGVVLLRGEAGIGKSALLAAFLHELRPATDVMLGSCDGVSTPRPFSPLYDIVAQLGPELKTLLHGAAPRLHVCDWVFDRVASGPPTVLAVEDVQWADEATLDMLVYLARRVPGTHAMLVATLREGDDAAPAGMLGALATMPSVRHVLIPPLTAEGVMSLAQGSSLDPAELHHLSGGNPFFVAEVLSAGDDRVPISVADSITARVARLDQRARHALNAAAILGGRVEHWHLAAVAGEQLPGIDDCVAAGLLRKVDGGLAFRHELTRMCVIEAMPVIQGIALHRRALRALERSGSADHARMAHHAQEAGDAGRVLHHARRAAAAALRSGSYREARQQVERALRFGDALSDLDRADLLEMASYALHLVSRQQEAYDLRLQALDLRRRSGDRLREGECLRWLSRLGWIRGIPGHEEQARAAVALLEPLGDTHELRMAISNVAGLAMINQRTDEALTLGRRALEMGRAAEDHEVVTHALNNLGSTLMNIGDPRGVSMLRESLAVARQAGLAEHVDRALFNLGAVALGRRDLDTAESSIRELIEWTSRTELERCSLEASLAEVMLHRGELREAERLSTITVLLQRPDPQDRCQALAVLARTRMRRGEPVDDLLADARELASRLAALSAQLPVQAARAEHAWLTGDDTAVIGDLHDLYARAQATGDAWAIGELGCWLWRAGELATLAEDAAPPYRLEASGEHRAAAAEWDRLGMPFEAAMALGTSAEPSEMREAFERLTRLGAPASARRIAARLGAAGWPIPRGPRPSTRANQSLLTERQWEVARLIAEGRSNAEIAGSLVLSEKTVGHHVSAILGKLGVRRRGEVVRALAAAPPPPG